MTDEDIRELNSFPQILPNFLLRRVFAFDEVTADFDMRTVNYGDIWTIFLDQWNETRHLMVIDNDNVDSTTSKRTAFGKPVSIRIIFNLTIDLSLTIFRQAEGRICDAFD